MSKTNNQNPGDVDETVWNDFVILRKSKRAPITATAMKTIRREAEKAGYTITEALTECCSRGWAGFKAEWVQNNKPKTERQNYKPKIHQAQPTEKAPVDEEKRRQLRQALKSAGGA